MKDMKYLILSVALLFANIAIAHAEEKSSPFEVKRVAVVDVKQVMDESVAAKAAQKEIASIKDKYLDEIKASDKKLQDRRKELLDQKKVMDEKTFNKKVSEFESKVQQERVAAAKKQKIVEAAFVKSLELIRDETLKIVAEIAKDKNYDLVMPTSQLLYSNSGADITDEVLKKINERLTKVNINIKNRSDDKSKDKSKDEKSKKEDIIN